MSLGIHRLWKDDFVSSLLPRLPPTPPAPLSSTPTGWDNWQPQFKILDVAGGTGDIALRFLDRAKTKYGNREVQVEVVDLNEGMLRAGQERVMKGKTGEGVWYNSECYLEWKRWYTKPEIWNSLIVGTGCIRGPCPSNRRGDRKYHLLDEVLSTSDREAEITV